MLLIGTIPAVWLVTFPAVLLPARWGGRWIAGKGTNSFQGVLPRAFSSEVDTGSREENASKQEREPPFRFNRNGKGSSVATAMLFVVWTAAFLVIARFGFLPHVNTDKIQFAMFLAAFLFFVPVVSSF